MNNSDTLSVDPGRTTLGALHPEFNTEFLRSKAVRRACRNRSGKNTLNFIFAINALRSNGKGVAMLLLRWALGALLIISGSFILSGEINCPVDYIRPDIFAIIEIATGSMLVLGLLTRLSMGLATIGFGIMATLSITHGIFDLESLMCCMACMVFLIFGSGKYSCDFLLRKAIILRSSRLRRKMRENKLSYKAFRYASTNYNNAR